MLSAEGVHVLDDSWRCINLYSVGYLYARMSSMTGGLYHRKKEYDMLV